MGGGGGRRCVPSGEPITGQGAAAWGWWARIHCIIPIVIVIVILIIVIIIVIWSGDGNVLGPLIIIRSDAWVVGWGGVGMVTRVVHLLSSRWHTCHWGEGGRGVRWGGGGWGWQRTWSTCHHHLPSSSIHHPSVNGNNMPEVAQAWSHLVLKVLSRSYHDE